MFFHKGKGSASKGSPQCPPKWSKFLCPALNDKVFTLSVWASPTPCQLPYSNSLTFTFSEKLQPYYPLTWNKTKKYNKEKVTKIDSNSTSSLSVSFTHASQAPKTVLGSKLLLKIHLRGKWIPGMHVPTHSNSFSHHPLLIQWKQWPSSQPRPSLLPMLELLPLPASQGSYIISYPVSLIHSLNHTLSNSF